MGSIAAMQRFAVINARLTAILVALFVMSSARASESLGTPARFVQGDSSPQELIEFPAIEFEDNTAVTLYCVAGINKTGRSDYNQCFKSESVNEIFKEEVESALKPVQFTPATINGETYFVELYYRVIFLRKDGVAEVRVFPNWGHDVDRYGFSYEAPQRYTRHGRPSSCTELTADAGLKTTMTIGKDGLLVGDILHVPDYRGGRWSIHGRCVTSIKRKLEISKYIPGHHDGNPVEATFVEIWGYFDSIRFE